MLLHWHSQDAKPFKLQRIWNYQRSILIHPTSIDFCLTSGYPSQWTQALSVSRRFAATSVTKPATTSSQMKKHPCWKKTKCLTIHASEFVLRPALAVAASEVFEFYTPCWLSEKNWRYTLLSISSHQMPSALQPPNKQRGPTAIVTIPWLKIGDSL